MALVLWWQYFGLAHSAGTSSSAFELRTRVFSLARLCLISLEGVWLGECVCVSPFVCGGGSNVVTAAGRFVGCVAQWPIEWCASAGRCTTWNGLYAQPQHTNSASANRRSLWERGRPISVDRWRCISDPTRVGRAATMRDTFRREPINTPHPCCPILFHIKTNTNGKEIEWNSCTAE